MVKKPFYFFPVAAADLKQCVLSLSLADLSVSLLPKRRRFFFVYSGVVSQRGCMYIKLSIYIYVVTKIETFKKVLSVWIKSNPDMDSSGRGNVSWSFQCHNNWGFGLRSPPKEKNSFERFIYLTKHLTRFFSLLFL